MHQLLKTFEILPGVVALALIAMAPAEALSSEEGIQGTISVDLWGWQAACLDTETGSVPQCRIPEALSEIPVRSRLELVTVTEPGVGGVVTEDFEIIEPGTTKAIRGRLSIYSIIPPSDRGLPPYLQPRIEITSPARAVCAQSVRWAKSDGVPPMICVAYAAEGGLMQFGVTAIFSIEAQ